MTLDDNNYIQYLIDKNKIIDTTIKYAWAIDNHDWDQLNDVFTDDCTAYLSKNLNGVEEIKRAIKGWHNNLISQHMISNHIVEIYENTARCKCQLQAFHFRVNNHNSSHYLLIGMYEDNLLKINNKWKIKHRTLYATWTYGDGKIINSNSIPIPDALNPSRIPIPDSLK